MLSRQLHIQLDDDRFERVSRLARDGGMSVADVLREAIDRGLPSVDGRGSVGGSAALRLVLDADPMPVPDDPADLHAYR